VGQPPAVGANHGGPDLVVGASRSGLRPQFANGTEVSSHGQTEAGGASLFEKMTAIDGIVHSVIELLYDAASMNLVAKKITLMDGGDEIYETMFAMATSSHYCWQVTVFTSNRSI
jgi:hypothetical protein